MSSFASSLNETFSAALSGAPAAAPAASSPASSAPAAVEAAPAASPEPSAAPVSTPEPAPIVNQPEISTPAVTGAPATTDSPEIEEEFKFPDEQQAPVVEAKAEVSEDDDPFGGKPPNDAERAAVTKWLKTPKGRASLEQFKVARDVEKSLGFIPDAAQTKQAFQMAQHMQAMVSDFHSGNPADAQRWLSSLFLPQNGQPLSRGAATVAERMIPMLAERANAGDPNAQALYRTIAVPAVDMYIDELYSHAQNLTEEDALLAQTTLPQLRTLWLNVARFAESHRKNGQFRDIPQEMIDTGRDPNAVPPPDYRVTEIDAKLQRIETFEQQQVRQHQQQFNRAMQHAVAVPLSSDIDAALSQIKEQFPAQVYGALARQFHSEVVKLTKANPANLRAYHQADAIARQQPTRENIERAGKAWAEAARSTIRALRGKYLNDALGPKVQESAERHKTLEAAAQKRSAPSVAAPVGQNLAVGSMTPQKLPDGSMETVQEARLRALQALLPTA